MLAPGAVGIGDEDLIFERTRRWQQFGDTPMWRHQRGGRHHEIGARFRLRADEFGEFHIVADGETDAETVTIEAQGLRAGPEGRALPGAEQRAFVIGPDLPPARIEDDGRIDQRPLLRAMGSHHHHDAGLRDDAPERVERRIDPGEIGGAQAGAVIAGEIAFGKDEEIRAGPCGLIDDRGDVVERVERGIVRPCALPEREGECLAQHRQRSPERSEPIRRGRSP